MKVEPYMSAYQRKERAREKKRALEARSKLRKQRGKTPSPERDRHWNANTKTTSLFDPSVKKVDIFRIPKRKVDEKKGGKKSSEEEKKITTQEAIASAIESILHPTDKQREEEEIENIMRRKQPPPPLSPMGKQLSVAVPSPRLTEVVKVLEASTSPIDENVLQQISGTMMRSDRIDTRSSREYLDEKGVRLHNRETDLRNATRRVMIKSPDGQQYSSTQMMGDPSPVVAAASSPRGLGSRSPRGGLRSRRDDEGSLIDHPSFSSPYVKSQESRRKVETLKARMGGTMAAFDGGVVDVSTPGRVDWGKSSVDVSMSHVDMETTLNNIRLLRQVSGNGMSLGHLQDNLVSKLQGIYRTHDDAVQLLEEMDAKRTSSTLKRAGGAPDAQLRPSSAVVPPVLSPKRAPQPTENVRLPTASVEGGAGGEREGPREWYDATHLPSGHVKTKEEAFVHDRNAWQKKPVHLVDAASSVLTYSKTATGQTYGNLGAHREPQEALTKGDEDAMETLFKFTSAYVPPTHVPSVGATHETAGWAIQRNEAADSAPGMPAEYLRRAHEQSASLEESGVRASEGDRTVSAAHLQAENDDYITEAFRQKRLSAVKDFPRLDYMPHDLVQSVNTYMNDLHFMQGVRSAAFGARGVSMKFCIDRATDMIMKELVDNLADEIDKMLGKETELLVGKI